MVHCKADKFLAKTWLVAMVCLLWAAPGACQSAASPPMSIPAHARLLSLKLNSPFEKSTKLEVGEFEELKDILTNLKNWRKYKDVASFEELSQNWIRNYASTPEMKCTGNFYRGYQFGFQFLWNLGQVDLPKKQARRQLVDLVNGAPNIGKSTFLAAKGTHDQNKNLKFDAIKETRTLITDQIKKLGNSREKTFELIPEEAESALEVMKTVSQGSSR